jgi:atypical dual specificity phosphatase
MWSWSLNWHEITPNLVIGTCPMQPADVARLQKGARVDGILSVQHDDCLAYWKIDDAAMQKAGQKAGLRMVRVPIRDFDVEDSRRQLPKAVAALAGLRQTCNRVYVHCTAGLGRAPVTVIAYLVFFEGMVPEAAFEHVKARRPGSVPAWKAFDDCRRDLVARWSPAIRSRAKELAQASGNGDIAKFWDQACSEILRARLSNQENRDIEAH